MAVTSNPLVQNSASFEKHQLWNLCHALGKEILLVRSRHSIIHLYHSPHILAHWNVSRILGWGRLSPPFVQSPVQVPSGNNLSIGPAENLPTSPAAQLEKILYLQIWKSTTHIDNFLSGLFLHFQLTNQSFKSATHQTPPGNRNVHLQPGWEQSWAAAIRVTYRLSSGLLRNTSAKRSEDIAEWSIF